MLAVLSLIATACGAALPKSLGATLAVRPKALDAGGGLAPLTALPVSSRDVLTRPAVGVKIDNAPTALPQTGLNEADIVFEELVEGGVTRFLSVYHSSDVGQVGPVRSGRDVDADLFPPFGGVLGVSGAAPPTYSALFGAGLTVFEEGQAGGAIFRIADRAAPHNLLADLALLRAAAPGPPPAQPWPFAADPPADGAAISNTRAVFSERHQVSWVWRADQGRWDRGQNGQRHLDVSGEQLHAANVVLLRVDVADGGGVDVTGARTVTLNLVGSGDAAVLRDGRAYLARWTKAGPGAHFAWTTPSGEPLPLSPGRTWIELLPADAAVDIDVPQPGADAGVPPA